MQQIATQRYRVDQFTVLVRGIPICAEHKIRGCSVEHFFSKHHPYTYQSYQMAYDGTDVEELLHLASSMERKVERLRQTTVKKQNRSSMICHIFQPDSTDIEMYDEELQEVCRKIRLLQCEIVLKHKELPAAFVSFKSRWGAALAAQTQQHIHPLLWITEFAPEPRDVMWNNLAIPYRLLVLHKIAVLLAAFLLIVFFTIPVTAVQGIVKFEKLKIWFPPARAVQLIPGLSSVLTGYLPSAILNVFIYLIPYAMLAMASLEGDVSNSKKEIKTCSMVFYFLVGNVFFLSLLSGSLLDQLGESVTHPKNFPSHLASAVSAQMQDVYEIRYETHGQYWPYIHHYIFINTLLMQLTMIGLFGLKSKPGASISTIFLLLLTLLFNEYCKMRFLPSFCHCSIQTAMENDDRDEVEGQTEANRDRAVNAYQPPWMRPVSFTHESASTQPLVSA